MRLDLHMHTTASDGAWSPAAVVEGAAAGRLDVISITDHDTTEGFAAARQQAEGLRIQVIPGIEVSSSHGGRDVHVLGYFVDPQSPAMTRHGERAGDSRDARMREMVSRLAGQGIEITMDSVEAVAGPDRGVIGRPHLARALVDAGHASSMHDAFNSLIGDNSDAFVPLDLLDPMEAVEVILDGGGIPVWAHPPADMVEGLLPTMVSAGLRGLEVYRPRHKRSETLRLESIARSAGLLTTGGSDWHTPDYGSSLGDFHVTGDEVEGLLREGGM